jgi:hypothetical protein
MIDLLQNLEDNIATYKETLNRIHHLLNEIDDECFLEELLNE